MPTTRSPLRYPGGKAKLYNIICPIIEANVCQPRGIYIEPFAGGAGLALELLYKNKISKLVLNDVDYCISCLWNSCLHETDRLCDMVNDCDITIPNWEMQRIIYDAPGQYPVLAVGFAALFLNRCNISGVLKGGPIGGEHKAENINWMLGLIRKV